MTPRWWTSVGSAVGVGVAFAVWYGVAKMLPADFGGGVAERLGLACAALLPAACVLDLMILTQMWLRARSGAVDPLAGRDDTWLQVNQRALTNTVEQMAGFAPALLALAAGVSPDRMPYVIAAGVVFGLARLVFWAGYLLGPLTRAPGMAATFAINVAMLAAAIRVWFL